MCLVENRLKLPRCKLADAATTAKLAPCWRKTRTVTLHYRDYQPLVGSSYVGLRRPECNRLRPPTEFESFNKFLVVLSSMGQWFGIYLLRRGLNLAKSGRHPVSCWIRSSCGMGVSQNSQGIVNSVGGLRRLRAD